MEVPCRSPLDCGLSVNVSSEFPEPQGLLISRSASTHTPLMNSRTAAPGESSAVGDECRPSACSDLQLCSIFLDAFVQDLDQDPVDLGHRDRIAG